MKIFVVSDNEDAKCGGCNWPASHLYALADSQDEADELYESGDAGLCGDCMAELLVQYKYEIAKGSEIGQKVYMERFGVIFEKERRKKERNSEASEEEEKRAFVVYGKLGQPLAYIIPIEEEELTELQMSVCMEVFDAVDNAETLLRWEEVA